MHLFRSWTLLSAFAFLSLAGSAGLSMAEGVSEKSAVSLIFDEASLHGKYGTYSEVEIALSPSIENDPVHWEILTNSLPPGMSLEDTTASHILIFGNPQFQGQWCFVLAAKTDSGETGARELCFIAEDDEELQYPKFTSDRFLTPVCPD